MQEPEVINELHFFTPSSNWKDFVKIGELTRSLNCLKDDYKIEYPDSNYINLACNILDKLPSQMTVAEWITEIESGR